MAPSNEGERGGKRDNSGQKKAPRWWKSKEIIQESVQKNLFGKQYIWSMGNAKIEARCKRCSDSDFAAICCLWI